MARYNLATTTTLQPVTCTGMHVTSAPLSSFLRGPDGSVYQLNNGTKQHILSPATLTALGGAGAVIPTSSGWTGAPSAFSGGMPR